MRSRFSAVARVWRWSTHSRCASIGSLRARVGRCRQHAEMSMRLELPARPEHLGAEGLFIGATSGPSRAPPGSPLPNRGLESQLAPVKRRHCGLPSMDHDLFSSSRELIGTNALKVRHYRRLHKFELDPEKLRSSMA